MKLGKTANDVQIEQIYVMEPTECLFEIDGIVVAVLSMELKVSDGTKWNIYPYTTQIIPLSTYYDRQSGKLYTFHVNESR